MIGRQPIVDAFQGRLPDLRYPIATSQEQPAENPRVILPPEGSHRHLPDPAVAVHREASGRRHGIERLVNDQLGIVNAECLPSVVAPGADPTDIEVEPRKGRCRGGIQEFLQHRLVAGSVREPRHKGF